MLENNKKFKIYINNESYVDDENDDNYKSMNNPKFKSNIRRMLTLDDNLADQFHIVPENFPEPSGCIEIPGLNEELDQNR